MTAPRPEARVWTVREEDIPLIVGEWAEGVLESDAVIVGSPKHNPRLTAAAHATLALVSAYWERGEALAEREQEVARLREALAKVQKTLGGPPHPPPRARASDRVVASYWRNQYGELQTRVRAALASAHPIVGSALAPEQSNG